MKPIDNELRHRLRQTMRSRREELGLTIATVARRSGLGSAELYELYESGRRCPTLDRIPGIAKALELDVPAFCRAWLRCLQPEFREGLFPTLRED